MAYGATAPGDDYGWWIFGEQRDDRSSLAQQAEWANMQIQRAESGGTLTGYMDAGTGIGEKSTPSSMQESPQTLNGANIIAAYWLAVAAQEGRYSGWSADGVSKLLSAAKSFYENGAGGTGVAQYVSGIFRGVSAESISEVFTLAGQTLAQIAGTQPPLRSFNSYILKFQQMGDLDSIAYNRAIADASSLGVGEVVAGTVKGTAADLLHKVGIGEGGAVAAQAERDAANEEIRRQRMRPWLIGGGVVLALGIGYFFFIKD